MAKKKQSKPNLNKLHITDGKDRSAREKEVAKIRELESLLGMQRVNPYGTADRTIFAEKVELMPLEEMRELSIRVGVTPTNRQNELRKRLLDNFDDFLRRHRQTVVGATNHSIDPRSKEYESIKDLL